MSLKIWLPLINDLHNQGISNINATAVNVTIDSNGKTGGGCYFLSSASETNTSRIYTDLFTPTSNNFSMCCWYRASAENTDNGYLFGLSRKSEASLMLYKLGTTQFRLYINSYSAYTHNIDITQWHHLAITYDGTTCKLYVDGIYKMQRAQTIDYTQEEYRCFLNCRSSSSTTSGTGSVYGGDNYYNDFRLYDHCLSAAEVHEIAQGLILHYKLDDDYQYKWNLLNNTKYCTRENVRTNSWARGDVLSPGILQLTPTTATAYIRYVTEMDYKDWNNKTYTVSFDAQEIAAENEDYNVSSAIISYVGFMPVDRANSSVLISTAYDKFRRQDYDIKGEGWQHYTYTFTLPDVLNKGEDTALVDGSKFTVEFGKSASKKPLQIKNIKLELGTSDTGWMPSKTDMDLNENVIIDSSGYNHNGTITGTLSTDLSSAKHGAAIYCANGLTNYIDTPTLTLPTDNITLNIWFKSANDAPNDNYHIAVNSIGSSAGRNYYEMAVHKTGYFRGGLSINGQREVADCTSLTGCDGQWHMITMTYDGAVKKLYFDGELENSDEIAITTGLRPTAAFRLFRDGYVGYEFSAVEASLSDFRIYSTPLLDTDIKQLYNISMKIDHKGNGHCFEINESNFNKLSKRGILFNQMVEPYLVLSDGSKWKLMLYHYVDHGNNLFTEDNATYCNDLGLYSRLGEIQNYQYNDQYEYYVIQDGKEFRWTQTSSPINATVQNLTVVSGYLDPVNGLAKSTSQSSTYIGYGAWWGACGSYRSYSLSGKRGIPGFGAHDATGICEDYLIVYTRIYEPTFKMKNTSCEATQLIEY